MLYNIHKEAGLCIIHHNTIFRKIPWFLTMRSGELDEGFVVATVGTKNHIHLVRCYKPEACMYIYISYIMFEKRSGGASAALPNGWKSLMFSSKRECQFCGQMDNL